MEKSWSFGKIVEMNMDVSESQICNYYVSKP